MFIQYKIMRFLLRDLVILIALASTRAAKFDSGGADGVAVDRIVAEGAHPPNQVPPRCQELCSGDWSPQLPEFLFLVDERALDAETESHFFTIASNASLTKAEMKKRLAGWVDSLNNETKEEEDQDSSFKELYKHWAAAMEYEQGARLRHFENELANETSTLRQIFAKITSIKMDGLITFEEECRQIRDLLNATDDASCFRLTNVDFTRLNETERSHLDEPPFFTDNVDDAERLAFTALSANGTVSKAVIRQAQLEWAARQSPEVLPTLVVFQRAVAVSKRIQLAQIRESLTMENQFAFGKNVEAADALDLFNKIAAIEEDDSISPQSECRLIRQLVKDANPANPWRVIMGLPRRGEELEIDAASAC